MPENDFNRLTAFKIKIDSIVNSNYVKPEQGVEYIELSELRVSRVRVIATVVSKRINEDKTYAYLTIDDGTETIRIKSWKENVEKIENIMIGDIIELVGRVKEWGEPTPERYLTCEIIKKIINPNHWLFHKYELLLTKEKTCKIEEKKETGVSTGVDYEGKEISASKEQQIIKIIKENDLGKGTNIELIMKLTQLDEVDVKETLKNLIMDGLIYEPTELNYKILEV